MARKPPRKNDQTLFWLLSCLSYFFRILPHRVVCAVGVFLGWVWYYLIPVRRSVALANLRASLPELTESQRRRVARSCLVHWALSALEFLRLPGMDSARASRLIEYEGLEHLESALALGKGAIVATAHYGNFDLMACVSAARGIPIHVVTREQHVGSINRFWMKIRRRTGLGLVAAEKSAIKILKLLKSDQVVGLVIDQHMPTGRGIPVPFFGRLASTTHAPAILALTTAAPILPVTIERLAAGRHRISIEPALELERSDDRQADVMRVTQALNTWLEERIRTRPELWLWIHRRWKIPEQISPS